MEDWQGVSSPGRGTGGPIHVAQPADPNPVARAFVEAGPSIGLPICEDYNSGSMTGTTFFDLTIREGQRFSVVDGYLKPAMERPNLTVWTSTETARVLLNGTTCTGIEVIRGGESMQVHAEQEVILSAGVIGSPCILMRSGIGAGAELSVHGIEPTVELKGVGKNLQDHVLIAGINYECRGPLPAPHNNGAEGTLWAWSDYKTEVPDIQAVVLEFPFVTPEHAALLPSDQCYAIAPSIVQPESRGSVRLTSAAHDSPPAIDVNFLGTDRDIRVTLQAMKLCRELGQADSFSELRKREVMPGDLPESDMIEFLRNGSTTYFHPVGTCRMGSDDNCVVDPQLRVRGVERLRVADAAVMPTITCGNTNAPSIMIGEKCADLIRG